MSRLSLYFDLMSQPSRAVWIFLKAAGIPFQEKPVALRKGEHQTEEFAKLNPFQLVPVIDDGGFVLYESFAIYKYLATSRSLADHWYPSDLKRRARIESYLQWHSIMVRLIASQVFRLQIIEPRAMNKPVDRQKLAKYENILSLALDSFETVWLKETPYICSNDISIADVACICELMQVHAVDYPLWEDRPKLEAWSQRVRERLNPHFDQANFMVDKVRKNFLASKM